MTFQTTGQMLMEVVDNPSVSSSPVVMYSERPSPAVVMEMHDPNQLPETPMLDVGDDVQIVVDELPGVESLDPDLEHSLEVSDAETVSSADSLRADNNEVKKSKKDPKWDWESHGAHGFVAWIKQRLDEVPKHSGYDTAGIERAVAYLERLDNEISKAMRLDLDGALDANKIEEVRSKIDDGIARLHDRLDKVRAKKGKRKKKSEADLSLVKEAQKIPTISGIVITVPLLISRIARVCINGTISAGHDIESIMKDQCEKYKLSPRERAELETLITDMGFPVRKDRGYLPDEDIDYTDGKYDHMSQYWA
jgi:hypothetical protein